MRASDIKRGQAVIIDGKLYVVTNADHNTPGNLRAKVQFKMRDVLKGTIQDKRVGATDDIETTTLDSGKPPAPFEKSMIGRDETTGLIGGGGGGVACWGRAVVQPPVTAVHNSTRITKARIPMSVRHDTHAARRRQEDLSLSFPALPG